MTAIHNGRGSLPGLPVSPGGETGLRRFTAAAPPRRAPRRTM